MTSSDNGDQEIYDGYSVDDEDQPGDVDDTLGTRTSSTRSTAATRRRSNTPPARATATRPGRRSTARASTSASRQEEPEPDPYAETDDDHLDDGEVGDRRAGRLVTPTRASARTRRRDLLGDDVGIDAAPGSAEEAAMHIVEDYRSED